MFLILILILPGVKTLLLHHKHGLDFLIKTKLAPISCISFLSTPAHDYTVYNHDENTLGIPPRRPSPAAAALFTPKSGQLTSLYNQHVK